MLYDYNQQYVFQTVIKCKKVTKAQNQDTYKHKVHLRLTVMPPTYDISQNNCVMLRSTNEPDIFHTYCQSDFQFCPLHIQHTSPVLPFSPICV
jgi:hypothetical protein